jgi:hypothetical protein
MLMNMASALSRPESECLLRVFHAFQNSDARCFVGALRNRARLAGTIPYSMLVGRTLIITSDMVIRDKVLERLDNEASLNTLIVDDTQSPMEYRTVDVAVYIVHSLKSSWKDVFSDPSLFDLIIVLDAHTYELTSWNEVSKVFSNSKVIFLCHPQFPFEADFREVF